MLSNHQLSMPNQLFTVALKLTNKKNILFLGNVDAWIFIHLNITKHDLPNCQLERIIEHLSKLHQYTVTHLTVSN